MGRHVEALAVFDGILVFFNAQAAKAAPHVSGNTTRRSTAWVQTQQGLSLAALSRSEQALAAVTISSAALNILALATPTSRDAMLN